MKELNIELADILEVESVTDDEILNSFENWDSLSILSLTAFVDKNYNIQISNDDLSDVKTLADIKNIIAMKN
jgi:acyl carrier protein